MATRPLAVLLGALLSAPAAGAIVEPGTLDLTNLLRRPDEAWQSAALTRLDPEAAAAILAAPALGDEGLPGDGKSDEAALIGQMPAALARDGKTLTITTGAGRRLRFVDWNLPERPLAEGEQLRFRYAGVIGKAGYHRVQELSAHDAPDSLLMAPRSGRAVRIYDGGDKVALAPDGERLAEAYDGRPFGLAIAALGEQGPRVDLVCYPPRLPYSDPRNLRLTLKGWRDGRTLDAVLSPAGRQPGSPEALRLSLHDGRWRIAAADPAHVEALGGLRCREGIEPAPFAGGESCFGDCDGRLERSVAAVPEGELRQLIDLARSDTDEAQAIAKVRTAIEAMQRPPHGDRKAARAANEQGIAALRANDYAGAAERFLAGHLADRADVELLNNLGYAYLLAGDEHAERYLVETLRLSPAYSNAWASLGRFYAVRGKPDDAAACFALAWRFSAHPDKTVRLLDELAAKEPQPGLAEAVARFKAKGWVTKSD